MRERDGAVLCVYNGIVSEREREERKREREGDRERDGERDGIVRENWEECGMGKSGRNEREMITDIKDEECKEGCGETWI